MFSAPSELSKHFETTGFPLSIHLMPKSIRGMNLLLPFMKTAHLNFKVNDEVFTVIDDEPLKGGQAGLVVADGQAHFDDVEITGPNISNGGPGKARPVNPKAKLATTWGKLKKN